MATYPLVQFVATPDVGATVRYDLNTAPSTVLSDGFNLGAPELSGDPDGIGGDFSLRTIMLTQTITGNQATAIPLLSKLARELLRGRNWLLFQLNATSTPVWFRTYRTSPGEISLENVYSDALRRSVWQIQVTLSADALAVGATVTAVNNVTLSNDPTAGGCFLALPDIKGDAPAPLRVELTPSASWTGKRIMLATAAVDSAATYAGPILWQSSAFAAGTDTGDVTAAAAYSGTGYRQVSFASDATLQTRLSGTAPTTPPPGRYTVYARVGRSDTSSTFGLRFGQGYGLSSVNWGPTVQMTRAASPAADHITWVPLGDFTFPFAADLRNPDNIGGVTAPTALLQVSRLSGTGAARLDALMLVPSNLANALDQQQYLSWFTGFGLDTFRTGVYDADDESFRSYDYGNLTQGLQQQAVGIFPSAAPGAKNVLHLLHQVLLVTPYFPSVDNSDALSVTVKVKVTYRPRYLYVATL